MIFFFFPLLFPPLSPGTLSLKRSKSYERDTRLCVRGYTAQEKRAQQAAFVRLCRESAVWSDTVWVEQRDRRQSVKTEWEVCLHRMTRRLCLGVCYLCLAFFFPFLAATLLILTKVPLPFIKFFSFHVMSWSLWLICWCPLFYVVLPSLEFTLHISQHAPENLRIQKADQRIFSEVKDIAQFNSTLNFSITF